MSHKIKVLFQSPSKLTMNEIARDQVRISELGTRVLFEQIAETF